MELLVNDYAKDYKHYKLELDTELNKAADGFVKIGYLLKIARDTDILQESGYANVTEFASREYGLTKDVVSRYIAINDRFSEGGYSPVLSDRFRNLGYAKLQEMLTLPDNIIEHISVETTKAEVLLIKKEYAEEQKVSDIDVAIEAAEQMTIGRTDDTPENNAEQLIYEYLHSEPEEYERLFNHSDPYEQLVPTGTKTIIGRIPGVGKLIMSIKDKESDIILSNMRDTSYREKYSWEYLENYVKSLCSGEDMKERWKEVFGDDYPVKEKPASQKPVSAPSKKSEDKKKETPKKKDSRLSVIKPKIEEKAPEKVVKDISYGDILREASKQIIEECDLQTAETVEEIRQAIRYNYTDSYINVNVENTLYYLDVDIEENVIRVHQNKGTAASPTIEKQEHEFTYEELIDDVVKALCKNFKVAPVQPVKLIMSKEQIKDAFDNYYNAMDNSYHAMKKCLRDNMKAAAKTMMVEVQNAFSKIMELPDIEDEEEE